MKSQDRTVRDSEQKPPAVIGTERRGLVSFEEKRVCLECGRMASVEARPCLYCKSPNHTRTMLMVTTRRIEGRPVVSVVNFGNHE